MACLADARSKGGYQELFRETGFDKFLVEDHGQAVQDMVKLIENRLLLGLLAPILGPVFGSWDVQGVLGLVRRAGELWEEGQASYLLLTARR